MKQTYNVKSRKMKRINFFIVRTSIVLLSVNYAYAQSVSIDSTFGQNGMSSKGAVVFDFDKQGNIIAFSRGLFKTDANGILDSSFGTNGLATLPEYGETDGKVLGLKVTNENKILLIFWIEGHSFTGEGDFLKNVMLRYNEDGSLDKSFGNNGEITFENLIAFTVNTENDDYMLIVYDYYGYFPRQESYISKYNYNLEIDLTFGINGKTYLTDNQMPDFRPSSIKILNDQSIILTGSNGIRELAFCKLNPDGSFATNFADNGVFVTNIDNNPYQKLFMKVIEENNGNLAITGRIMDRVDAKYICRSFICGFSSNGTINQNFGENGFFYYGNFTSIIDNQTVLQNGKTYLIGERKKIISINNNGTLDSTFGNSGSFIFDNIIINDMKFQGDKIIVGGSSGIARLNIPFHNVSVKPNSYSNNSIKIYPNPTMGQLRITNYELRENTVIEIFDIYGRKFPSFGGAGEVDISHLANCMYFIKIDNKVIKIIKN